MPALGPRTNLPPEHLTPVRIRGKKGQKLKLHAIQEQRVQRAMTERPNSLPSPTKIPQSSRLENLPNEVLQSIFFYSQNFLLPGLSLTLCRALSSQHIKDLTICSIFTLPTLINCSNDETREIGKVQSALLRCRWVDNSAVQRMLRDRQAVALASYLDHPYVVNEDSSRSPLQNVEILGPACPIGDASLSATRRFLDSLDTKELTQETVWIRHWISNSDDLISMVIPPKYFPMYLFCSKSSIGDSRCSGPISPFDVASGCEIPTKLLHGPWTDSKLEFLEFLKETGAELDWETGNSGEVAESSMEEAILQGNVEVLRAISKRSLPYRRRYPLPAMEQVCHDTGVVLIEKHFRLAVLEAGCDKSVVTAILDVLDPDLRYGLRDSDIYEWIIEQDAKGNDCGKWLLCQLDPRGQHAIDGGA
ncbi:MAG: hypothetical protein Q9202_004243 [Teloschistes flavicans]